MSELKGKDQSVELEKKGAAGGDWEAAKAHLNGTPTKENPHLGEFYSNSKGWLSYSGKSKSRCAAGANYLLYKSGYKKFVADAENMSGPMSSVYGYSEIGHIAKRDIYSKQTRYTPHEGDVSLTLPGDVGNDNHQHMCIYIDGQWVSDFRQKSQFVYAAEGENVHVYSKTGSKIEGATVADGGVKNAAPKSSGGSKPTKADKLASVNIEKAIKFNNGSLCTASAEAIQKFLKITVTKKFDEATVRAIAKWQLDSDLPDIDGKFGNDSKTAAMKQGMVFDQASSEKANDGYVPSPLLPASNTTAADVTGWYKNLYVDFGTSWSGKTSEKRNNYVELTEEDKEYLKKNASKNNASTDSKPKETAKSGGGIIGSVCTVTSKNLNLRQGPGTEYPSEKDGSMLKKGDTYTVLNEKNGWLEISYKGQSRWICGKLTSLKEKLQIQTATEVTKLLKAKGMHLGAIAGILGNMQAESGMSSNMTLSTLQGVDGGLCSWHATRAANLAKLDDWQSVETQVNFLWSELTGKGFAKLNEFLADPANAENPEKCAGAFVALFERPKSIDAATKKAGKDVYLHDVAKYISCSRFVYNSYDGRYYCDLGTRLEYARKYYDMFK